MPSNNKKDRQKKDKNAPATREYTINLHKRLHKVYVLID